MKNILFLLCILLPGYCHPQAPLYPITSLPVIRNGITLSNPWAGGLDAPEFSSADINNDGKNDLFIFDRAGNKVLVFLNDGSQTDTAFHYAPEWETVFPPMVTWAVLRDYNHDGIPDIFANQPGGLQPDGSTVPAGVLVYKGTRPAGNIKFERVKDCLYYNAGSFKAPLWTNGLGVPAITDINHDGDIDILTFDVYGSTIGYYENQTVDSGLSADSMIFIEASPCWGKVYVSGSSLPLVTLGVSCKGGTGSTPPPDERHTGATLWQVDYGTDNNVNLAISGAHISSMIFLKNTGNSALADIGWMDTLFPSCNTSIHAPVFPAAFQVDGDNDGLADLLVAPNFGYPSPALNVNNVQLYKRSTDTCGYEYSGNDSFLVHTMLDFGTSSSPAFFDYNGDSLPDIVVGNLFYYNPITVGYAQLALYRNTGTRTNPAFTLVTNDYAGLSAFHLTGLSPAFGDLDGDGKPDMLLGNDSSNLYFFKNMGDTLASFPAMTTPHYFGLSVGNGNYSTPFIYDANNDGLPDIVMGCVQGTLRYYWNFGTKNNPQFSIDSVDTVFGAVNVTPASTNIGNSVPFLMRDSTGNLLLFAGAADGSVHEYAVDTLHLRGGHFTQLDSDFLHHTVGFNAAMQAHDLNADGKPEYIVGNARGGLQMFSPVVWDSAVLLSNNHVETNFQNLQIFPNPANGSFTCKLDLTNSPPQIALYNMLSQKMDAPFSINRNSLLFNTLGLNEGMYVLRLSVGEKNYSGKVVVQH